MHTLRSSSLMFACLLALSSAAPSNRDIAYSKLHRQSIISTPKNGVIEMDKIFSKYGMQKPEGLADAAVAEKVAMGGSTTINEKSATGSGKSQGTAVASSVKDNTEYVCPVTIGGQTLNLNVDTGSSDVWVFNTGMPAEDQQSNRTVFNSYASKSYDNVPAYTFSVGYGDQSETYGTVGTDTVKMAGLTATSQYIGMPSIVSHQIKDDTWADGILGLGFQSNSGFRPDPQPSFFERIVATLQAPLFTANLKKNTAGNYQFGYIDNTAYSGELHYSPVNNSQGYWQFDTSPGHSPAIADTGSSVILLDLDLVQNYWKRVPSHSSNSQGIIFPCTEKLPDFTIQLGDSYTATISGELINYVPLNETYCLGGIQFNNGQGLNVFGDIMFQSQFVVFDYGNMQIGFAPHA